MGLAEQLRIEPGVTAVIGSGGKTSLLRALAEELRAARSTVVLTTTTHILPFAGVPTLLEPDAVEVVGALVRHRVVCVGAPAAARGEKNHKLVGSALAPAELARLADYVLVESDGSRGLPLKAHELWEPVVPEGSTQTILVVGARGFGRPVAEAAHRVERFCELAGCAPGDAATPELVAHVIAAEALADRVVVNQADTPALLARARELAALLAMPVVLTSLRRA